MGENTIDLLRDLGSKEATLLAIRDEMASYNAARQGAPSTLDNINALLEEIGLDA